MKSLDFILFILAVLVAAFITAMIITFWHFQSVPDVLITAVLGTGTAELVAAAAIQIFKKKYEAQLKQPEKKRKK